MSDISILYTPVKLRIHPNTQFQLKQQESFCQINESDCLAIQSRVGQPSSSTPAHQVLFSGNTTLGLVSKVFEIQDEMSQYGEAILKRHPVQLFSLKGGFDGLMATQAIQKLQQAKRITMGDLHGSTLKLIETLKLSDLIDLEQEQYESFSKHLIALEAIAAKDPKKNNLLIQELNPDHLNMIQRHVQAIEKIIPTIKWKNPNRELILIGDVIADRGVLDTLTLKLLQHLRDSEAANIKTLIGNHELFAIRAWVNNHSALNIMTSYGYPPNKYMASLVNSYWLAEKENQCSSLKALYLDYIRQSAYFFYDEPSQVLYTHAPVTQQTVKQLIQGLIQYGIISGPKVKTKEQVLQEILDNPAKLNEYERKLHQHLMTCIQGKNWSPITDFSHWYRKREEEGELSQVEHLPLKDRGVTTLVHGHDDGTQSSPFLLSEWGFSKKGTMPYKIINLNQKCCDAPDTKRSHPNLLLIED